MNSQLPNGTLVLGKPAVSPEPETPTSPESTNKMSVGACISRGRIKGGYRFISRTEDGSVAVFVEFTRKSHKRAHRLAVRDGIIPKNGHMAEAFVKQIRRTVKRRTAR